MTESATDNNTAGPSEQIKVFQPAPTPQTPSTPSEVDETYFQPTLADVQAHHASVVARNKRLNDAPLLTSKYRDEEREGREKRKAEKWPTTTIRIKFSDGTQVQSVFPSSSPIQPVYDFVRTTLDPSAQNTKFTLWQPPRFTYPEHPPPPDPSRPKPKPSYRSNSSPIVTPANYGLVKGSIAAGLSGGTGGKETLSELGLVPQSVLMVRWEDEGMNASGYPAPLIPELRQKAEPLPKPQSATQDTTPSAGAASSPNDAPKTGEKKIPKWLAKGLMKKK